MSFLFSPLFVVVVIDVVCKVRASPSASLPSLALHTELLAAAYGDKECDEECKGSLSKRLQNSEDTAIGSACVAAIEGRLKFAPGLRWPDMLKTHVPVWRFLELAGAPVEEVDQQELEIWALKLVPHTRAWVLNSNQRVSKDHKRSYRGFADFLKYVKKCPSLSMQAEMLAMAANSLRKATESLSIDLTPDTWPEKIHMIWAEEHFLTLAQRVAERSWNISKRSWPSPRLLGLLRWNERERLQYDFSFIARFIPSNPVVVFAGAHTGTVLRYVLETWPEGRINAFEADPFFFAALAQNYQKYFTKSNIRIEHAALWSRDGETITLRTRNGAGAQSTLFDSTEVAKTQWPDAMRSLDAGSKVQVGTVSLFELAKRQGIQKLDYLYLDVECAEWEVLQGMGPLLQTVTVMSLEVSNAHFCKGSRLWPEVRDFLRSVGFSAFVVPPPPRQIIMDIVAIRSPSD